MTPMNTLRSGLAVSVLNGCLYAVGGGDGSSIFGYCGKLGLAVVNEKLLAVGGNDFTADLDTVEIFEPDKNHWKNHSCMNDGRIGAGVGVIRMP
ncbi:kelch repeat protein [Ostertagia ostertagi]